MNEAQVSRSLARNAAATMVGRVVYLLSRAALPPLTLAYLGLEQYGLWTLSFVLLTYLGMGTFGVANVYVRYVAEYAARNDTAAINSLISTGLLVTGAFGALTLVALWPLLPVLVPWFGVEPNLQAEAVRVLFAAAAAFAVEMSLGAFAHVLIGLQRGAEQTAVWVAASLLETVLVVVLLPRGWGIDGLLVAFAVRLLVGVGAQAWRCKRALPGLSLGWTHLDRRLLRIFFGYGSTVQLSGLLGIFLYSIEKTLAGLTLGAAAAGLFDVGEKLAVMASGIPASLNGVLLPALAHLHSRSVTADLAPLYLRASRAVGVFAAFLMAGLAAFAPRILQVWLGTFPQAEAAAFILTVFAPAFHLHVVTGPASALHRAVGKPRRELIYPLLQLLLISLSFGLGLAWFGAGITVISGSVAGSMVASSLVYTLWTNHLAGVSFATYGREVWAPSLILYGLAGACAALTNAWPIGNAVDDPRLHALGELMLGGTLYAGLAAGLALTWLLHPEERAALRRHMAAALPRRRRFGFWKGEPSWERS